MSIIGLSWPEITRKGVKKGLLEELFIYTWSRVQPCNYDHIMHMHCMMKVSCIMGSFNLLQVLICELFVSNLFSYAVIEF